MGYFERYAYYSRPKLSEVPPPELEMSIVIPCHNEPNIITTLESLKACLPPSPALLEIIIVVNASEEADEPIRMANQQSMEDIRRWSAPEWINIHVMHEVLPKKHAGVGLARKIGMDEAARRFETLNKDGIIIALDADCTVMKNYLTAIQSQIMQNRARGASIRFEHPLDGRHPTQIINYELHLRYFINAQRWAGFPYAYQTVGSSMAVTSKTYQKVGGMPKRQAGEDFYFLHKVIPLGDFIEINDTVVKPSDRESHRVPFGTGKDISTQKQTDGVSYTSYAFQSFVDLKAFFKTIDRLYSENYSLVSQSWSTAVNDFLNSIDFESDLNEIKSNVASPEAFRKRFFNWFNAFMIMKYCHHLRDHHYPDQEVLGQSNLLAESLLNKTAETKSEALLQWRKFDASR